MNFTRVFTTWRLFLVILVAGGSFFTGYYSQTPKSAGTGITFLLFYAVTWLVVEALNPTWLTRISGVIGVGLGWGACLLFWEMAFGKTSMQYGALVLSVVIGLGLAAAVHAKLGAAEAQLPEQFANGRLGLTNYQSPGTRREEQSE